MSWEMRTNLKRTSVFIAEFVLESLCVLMSNSVYIQKFKYVVETNLSLLESGK